MRDTRRRDGTRGRKWEVGEVLILSRSKWKMRTARSAGNRKPAPACELDVAIGLVWLSPTGSIGPAISEISNMLVDTRHRHR